MNIQIEQYIDRARSFIASDWTGFVEQIGSESGIPTAQSCGHLEFQIGGVIRAEVLVYFDPLGNPISDRVTTKIWTLTSVQDSKKHRDLESGFSFLAATLAEIISQIEDATKPARRVKPKEGTVTCDIGATRFTVEIAANGGGTVSHEPKLFEPVEFGKYPETGYYTAGEIDSLRYNAAIDTIEWFILALAVAGFDISSPEFAEALITTLDGVGNRFDAGDDDNLEALHVVILDGMDQEPFQYASFREAMGGLIRLTRSAYAQHEEDGIERKVYLVIGDASEFKENEDDDGRLD